MKYARIEKIANELLNKTKSYTNVPLDIMHLAKQLNFVVGNAKLSDNDDGFILVDRNKRSVLGQDSNKVIGVKASLSVEWKRFTIAHELGHYFLHFSDNEYGLLAHREHRKGKGKEENEADYFAACLLLPRDKFIDLYNKVSNTTNDTRAIISILASSFMVTHEMAERRIKELKLND